MPEQKLPVCEQCCDSTALRIALVEGHRIVTSCSVCESTKKERAEVYAQDHFVEAVRQAMMKIGAPRGGWQ